MIKMHTSDDNNLLSLCRNYSLTQSQQKVNKKTAKTDVNRLFCSFDVNYIEKAMHKTFAKSEFFVIKQGGDKHNKAGACVVYQGARGWRKPPQHRKCNGDKVNKHRKGYAKLDGTYRSH